MHLSNTTSLRRPSGLLFGALFLALAGTAGASVIDLLPDDLRSTNSLTVVRAQYSNKLANTETPDINPPADVSNSFAVFGGGSFGSYAQPDSAAEPVVPQGTYLSAPVLLQSCSLGETFSSDVPYDRFAKDFLDVSRGLLFGDATFGSEYPLSQAAFRFKDQLFGKLEDFDSAADPAIKDQIVNRLEVRLATGDDGVALLNSFYGQTEKDRADTAEAIIRYALRYAPLDQDLADTLLDIYYYRAQFQTMIAKEKLVKAAELPLDPAPADWVINKEIDLYKQVIEEYSKAADVYFDLLKQPLYVNGSDYYSQSEPFGLFLFKTFQPRRSLLSASYVTANQEILPVEVDPLEPTRPAVLLGGFKDLALLLDAMNDQGRAAVDLARRYAMRGNVNGDVAVDLQSATELLTNDRLKLELRGDYLLGKSAEIPGFDPANLTGSGVPEAVAGFQVALAQQSSTLQFIRGNTNILGFSDDFLFLIGDLPNAAGATFDDSFDRLAAYLDETKDNNPLGTAVVRYNEAIAGRDTYKGSFDQLKEQFEKTREAYSKRLFDSVGEFDNTGPDQILDPQNPIYQIPFDTCGNPLPTGMDSPLYPAGEISYGSEMWVQANNIQQAFNQLVEFSVMQKNLNADIASQLQRIQLVFNIKDAKKSIYIKYGNKQASLEEEMSHWTAAEVASQSLANGIGDAAAANDPTGVVQTIIVGAYLVNSVIQAGAEVAKGYLLAAKERNAAKQESELVSQDFLIDDFDGKAELNRLLRDKDLLAVQTQGAVLNLAQQVAQLQALRDEANEILRRQDSWDADYAVRYHADPVHRLRYTESIIRADVTFKEAQKWVYYAARALEYKLNTPFLYDYASETYSSFQSVFRARNTVELRNIMQALKALNATFQTNPEDDRTDWISLRKDILGLTGADGIAKFREYLHANADDNGVVLINFNTVVDKGQFFRGPRSALDPGLWNDKIRYLKFNIPGQHTVGNNSVDAVLFYGDYAFLRRQKVGTTDTNRPDRLVDELREWNGGLWYYDPTDPPAGGFRLAPRQKITPKVALSSASQVEPPDSFKTTALAERAVAANNWSLLLYTEDPTAPVNIDEMDDFEIFFAHRAFDRQVAP